MKINLKKSSSPHECYFYGKHNNKSKILKKKNSTKLPWPMSGKSDTSLPDFTYVKKNDTSCKAAITFIYYYVANVSRRSMFLLYC